ncbi:tyrosine-type recombinase/integrase [Halobaculum rubrum]|uniref:tyrosine-type recombinase/integrase n=1 Tax=Halobaculum rubrum TaxID=2872158 RepID=UPI001CA399CE|nr:site-specific integrase [Halobaculum rubrum]QZX99382.1 site-specific integrase [Halobaculum rubrum]
MDKPEKVEGIVMMSDESRQQINQRQVVAYESHRKQFIRWLCKMGNNPDSLEGYAHHTAQVYAKITDKFHRWAWEHRGEFTLDLTHDEADTYIRNMVLSENDYSDSYLHNIKLALKAYFRFRDDADEWECSITISSSSSANNPRELLYRDERKTIREASLEYATVPSYFGLDPEGRRKWKAYLGRRYEKPVDEVGPEDFDRANGFKYPSIVHTSLDAGLRPIEVGRAKTYWVDTDNAALQIPAKESSKNENNWTVTLRRETAEYLSKWLEQRSMYEKYDNTDQLWLTRHSNPYSSSSLKHLLNELCEIAGIDRDLSWYALRHSTGTYMSREEGLAAAQSQLRHQSTETTMKYDNVSLEDRREALDRMG